MKASFVYPGAVCAEGELLQVSHGSDCDGGWEGGAAACASLRISFGAAPAAVGGTGAALVVLACSTGQ